MKNLGDFLSKPRKSLSDFYFTIKSYLLYIKLSFSLFSHSDLFLLQWTTTSISSSMTPFLLILLSFVWGWMKCFSSKMVLLKDSVSQSISSSSWTWDMLYSFHSLRLMSWNGGQWLLHFFLGFSFFRKMDDMNDTSSISSCSSTSTMVTSTTTMSTATETFLSHSTFKSKQGKKKTKKKSCSSTRSSSHSIALPTSPSPLPPSSPTLLLKTSTRTLTPPPKVNLPNTPESSPTYLTRQLTYPLTTSSYSFPKKKTFSSTPFSILPSSSTHPTPPLPLPSSSSTSSPSPSPSPSPLPPLPPLSPPLRTSTTPFFSSSTSFDTMAPWMRKTSSFKRTNSTSTVKKQISSLFQLKRHQGQEPTTLSPFQYSRKNEPLSSSLFSWSPLPECFFHLPPLMVSCLLELDLSHLHLSSVPEPIQYLSQLQILRLHSNCIGSIPPFLAEFKRLKMLDLHGNQILSFHAPWIRNFVSLHLLDLSNNCLSFFSPYFAFLPYLQLVLLHQNPWQTHSAEIDELTQTYSVTTCFSPLRHSLTSLSSCKTTDSAIALHTCFYTPTMLFRSLTQVFPISLPLDEQYSLQLKSFLSMLRRETEENTFHPFNPSISHEFSSGHSMV
ncbi:hypothetical protein HMI56_006557 [Coelomomyces lativittatus]|nr:hypothetical protein HMI56_006557 [Coelomomyces lativittatus]